MASPGRPAELVRQELERLTELTGARLPGVELLGERAAIAGLTRQGPASCGGAFRSLRTEDGWLGLSLPRPSDLDLVPALVSEPEVVDEWAAVAGWASRQDTAHALDRATLLDLAASAVPPQSSEREPVMATVLGRRQWRQDVPLVVDLTSLWAGPLCAHLLGLAGADVIKVESCRRLDGARRGHQRFFDLLHAGHRMVTVDLRDPDSVVGLVRLVGKADLVLEASRPRAMRQLGIRAEDVVAAGTSWLSITAYGRDANRVGFGDDVAVGAGLHVVDGADLLPCGDALADPLAGVAAAVAAVEALRSDDAVLIDLSMHDVCAEAARGSVEPHTVEQVGDVWWVEADNGRFPVAPPRARHPSAQAGAAGTDNDTVLT